MHDLLYENQQTLYYYHLVEYASILDLNIERFNNDLFSHIYAGRVHEDFISGVRSGVNGTPTFFVMEYVTMIHGIMRLSQIDYYLLWGRSNTNNKTSNNSN